MPISAHNHQESSPSSPGYEPKLVDIPTARHLLGGIGKTRLYEYFYTGDLTRVKVGSRTCVTVSSINRLVDRLIGEASRA